jgi:hypothetical protein
MNYLQSPSLNMLDLAKLIEIQGNLDDNLQKIAKDIAILLEAGHCSILLFSSGEEQEASLRVFAHYGACVAIAVSHLSKNNLNSALHSQEIEESISEPILLCERVIGIIYVTLPCQKSQFNEQDKLILHLYAQQVSQSLHIYHLQNLTKSRFINMAIGQELATDKANSAPISPHPPTLAKIVAKAFFKELTHAGFSPREIIETATEVLNLLQKTIQKHKQRLDNFYNPRD